MWRLMIDVFEFIKEKKDINERIYQAFQGFSYPRGGKILQLFVRWCL